MCHLHNVRCTAHCAVSHDMADGAMARYVIFLSAIIRDHIMHPNTSIGLVNGHSSKYHIAF